MDAHVCIWVHMDAFGCTCMHLGAYACAPVYAYVFEHTQVRPFISKTRAAPGPLPRQLPPQPPPPPADGACLYPIHPAVIYTARYVTMCMGK